MYGAAFAGGGFVEIIFSLPDDAPVATQKRSALGITAELQELRDIAGVLQAESAAKTSGTVGAEISATLTDTVKQTQSIHVPTGLLTSSSPVFASMFEQGWKESNERSIRVQGFDRDAFRAFLDCLYAVANETVLPTFNVLGNPKLLRQVLPIAHCYQADGLKKVLLQAIRLVVVRESLEKRSAVGVTELVLAVESSLPEEAVPDWPMEVLQVLNYYFKCLHQDRPSEDLSLKTLRKLLAAPDCFDQFVDHFLHNLEWDDLHQPIKATEPSLKQTCSGPQYTAARYSNSGKTVMSYDTASIPWKQNLRSALEREVEKEKERRLSGPGSKPGPSTLYQYEVD